MWIRLWWTVPRPHLVSHYEKSELSMPIHVVQPACQSANFASQEFNQPVKYYSIDCRSKSCSAAHRVSCHLYAIQPLLWPELHVHDDCLDRLTDPPAWALLWCKVSYYPAQLVKISNLKLFEVVPINAARYFLLHTNSCWCMMSCIEIEDALLWRLPPWIDCTLIDTKRNWCKPVFCTTLERE